MSSKILKFIHNLFAGFLRKLYTDYANAYDAVAWIASNGRWQNWTSAVKPYIDGDDILELGIGPGHLFSVMQSDHPMVVGIDRSHAMVKLAAKNAMKRRNTSIQHPLPVAMADSRSLPFPREQFDVIYATFPTEYISAGETLASVSRSLKPHGELLILLAAAPIGNSLAAAGLKLLYRLTGNANAENSDQFDRFEKLLIQHGFTPTTIREYDKNACLLIVKARKK